MKLSNCSIRAKLMLAFGGLCLMVIAVAAMSLTSLSSANDRFVAYVKGVNAQATLARTFRTAVDRRAIAARNLVLVTKPADLELEKAAVTAAHRDVGELLTKLRTGAAGALGSAASTDPLLQEMEKVERAYEPVALGIAELALHGRQAEAVVRMNDECRPLLAALTKASSDYADHVDQQATEMLGAAEHAYTMQWAYLIGLCALAIAAAVLAGAAVIRSITRPLQQALQFADAVSAGDLTARLAPQGDDEVSRLLKSLDAMSGKLADIVQRVRDSSDSIATGSAEIASGSADLSRRTEQQASVLQQTAATMDELGVTVRTNADHALQASTAASGASEVAGRGGEVVGRVVATMKEINDGASRIADITSVIDGIAFQTNILALNAAVEAARAGEHGRGFAVVASEVRALAQRSAGAAKEIKGLIEHSVDRTQVGAQLVTEAGQTMAEVVASVRRVSALVTQISSASREQSTGVEQVGIAVSQIDDVTQQNAALVEQSAAAAESLRVQADQLVNTVAAFKLQ